MTQTGCSDKVTPVQADAATMHIDLPASETVERPVSMTPISQTHASGLTATWLPFGAHLQSVKLPDGTEILAQYETSEDYQGGAPYLGGLIGRVANRINQATFTVDNQVYAVADNAEGHSLHSGPDGFDRQIWDARREDEALVFRHSSPAGHQGFPGNLDVTIRARLRANELQVRFIAITDAPTPVNLTQHGYWSLDGLFGRRVDTLRLTSPAERYTEVGEDLIPTGQNLPVGGSPYDFRQQRAIGPDLMDVNLLVPGSGLREMATLSDGIRTLTVLSDYPGFQLYTGETLESVSGIRARGALAIEPQYPPNAVNQPVDGHDTILRPGEVYRHTIIYRFDGPGFDGPTLQGTTP